MTIEDRKNLIAALRRNRNLFAPVVNFMPGKDNVIALCFTRRNRELTPEMAGDTEQFCRYINRLLKKDKARYGLGGYNELRALYGRSNLFNAVAAEEPRRLHIGTDIWGRAGERVYAPMDGTVHSFAFNNHFGDYGATIILAHELNGQPFHTLYGHLSVADLEGLEPGMPVKKGQWLARFGEPQDNGYWPPHLHFQVIANMEGNRGDYPGVVTVSRKKEYLFNCPNPDYILNLDRYLAA